MFFSWLKMGLLAGNTMRCIKRIVKFGLKKRFNFLLVQQFFDKLLLNAFEKDLDCLYFQISFIRLAWMIFLLGVTKPSLRHQRCPCKGEKP